MSHMSSCRRSAQKVIGGEEEVPYERVLDMPSLAIMAIVMARSIISILWHDHDLHFGVHLCVHIHVEPTTMMAIVMAMMPYRVAWHIS